MGRTFVVAECCSSWRFGDPSTHLSNAHKMIEAAKECDADAAKFQWVSDIELMAKRRNDSNPKNYEIINYPFVWLDLLRKKCNEVGIEFMVTSFIPTDIPKIEPLVKRFKVAAAESSDEKFIAAHEQYQKPVIISYAFGSRPNPLMRFPDGWTTLHCVCSYPTPVDQANISRVMRFSGLSDHTTSTLTGALAVACGAKVIEKHVRIPETPETNPDFQHSLDVTHGHCDCQDYCDYQDDFWTYVRNIREAEKAMGTGEHVMSACEEVNLGRRVKM